MAHSKCCSLILSQAKFDSTNFMFQLGRLMDLGLKYNVLCNFGMGLKKMISMNTQINLYSGHLKMNPSLSLNIGLFDP